MIKQNRIMIDNKKIEEAALGYCAKCSDITNRNVDLDEDECVDLYNGFIDGAKWAINEFIKDLWHPANEVPEIGRVIIMENYYPDGRIEFHSRMRKSTSHNPIEGNTQKWLYVDDLLPKKGDEQ